VNRFNGRVRRSGQKAVNNVRSGGWLRFGPAITSELGLKSAESKQGPVFVQGEPHDILPTCRWIGLRRVFGEADDGGGRRYYDSALHREQEGLTLYLVTGSVKAA
jgi:hypothetical protein